MLRPGKVKTEGKAEETAAQVATLFLDVVPQAMRQLRAELRACRGGAELSVPHFRILAHLWREPASNKELAEQLGVSVAAMSRMLGLLEDRELVARKPGLTDKRCVCVRLTPRGVKHFASVRKGTRARLAERLGCLSSRELGALAESFRQIQTMMESIYEV